MLSCTCGATPGTPSPHSHLQEDEEGQHHSEESHGLHHGEPEDGVSEELLAGRGLDGAPLDQGRVHRADADSHTGQGDGGQTGTHNLEAHERGGEGGGEMEGKGRGRRKQAFGSCSWWVPY